MYLYQTIEGEMVWSKPGHLIYGQNSKVLFCGNERPQEFIVTEKPFVGRKLCEACALERKRLQRGKPTVAQVKIWWQGGREQYEKEIREFKGGRPDA